jgi:reactive intermediate/imine deaminase
MTMLCRNALVLILLATSGLSAAERKPVYPAHGAKPVGPYTPGVVAGDYLYVSGQGARDAEGRMPATFDEQVTQCLENVKGVIEAAGLTMQHVVFTQVYLSDMSNYDAMNRVYGKYFPAAPPARSTIGVARMPTETPVEITVVAVRDLSSRKVVDVPGLKTQEPMSMGILTADRLYISGMPGRDLASNTVPQAHEEQVKLALCYIGRVLKAAGLDYGHVAFVNPYLTKDMPMEVMNRIYANSFEFGNTPARATIVAFSLPAGANVTFAAVAARDLSQRRAVKPKNMAPSPTASPCVFVADTLYCSAKAGFIPGPNSGIYAEAVENQVRQTMRNLLDGLEEAGMSFANVVSTNVYLDNIDDFPKMNKVYGAFFPANPPTRTTVQPLAPAERKADANGKWPKLEEVSLIAVK